MSELHSTFRGNVAMKVLGSGETLHLLQGMLLESRLQQSSMVLLQLQANISVLLARHHQLPTQCCLSLRTTKHFLQAQPPFTSCAKLP